jgi:hypothetical protein
MPEATINENRSPRGREPKVRMTHNISRVQSPPTHASPHQCHPQSLLCRTIVSAANR